MEIAYLVLYQTIGPRGFGDLGRVATYFQGAGDHW